MGEQSESSSVLDSNLFGSGLSPIAPGTAGSLASLFIWAPVVMTNTPWYFRLLLILVLYILGTAASSITEKKLTAKNPDQKDPGFIVIDEVVGQGVALFLAGPSVLNIILGFLLFRIFDILKPWPVNLAEKNFASGTGIMLDDVVAGIYAMIVLGVFNLLI